MLIQDLNETSKNKLLNIGFALEDSIDQVGDGHGSAFGFYIDAPIHYAAREGDLDLLQELCDNKARINILCDTCNWTPIMWAGHYGRKDVVAFLIQKGADLTLKAPRTEYQDQEADGNVKRKPVLIPCDEKGKYSASSGYDLKAVLSEKNAFWPTTFFWTQHQKHVLGKQVDYSGTEALVDNKLNKLS